MVADRIKALREQKGLTQTDLSNQLGITRSSVNAWEMGISVPSTQYIVELAHIFKVSTDYLLCVDTSATVSVAGLTEKDVQLVHNIISHLKEKKPIIEQSNLLFFLCFWYAILFENALSKGVVHMEEQKKQGGKKPGQKFKSLLVWDILQKRTDENHAISLKEIVEHLKMYGITAERHSIKRDIDDILMLLNKDMDIDLDEHDIEDRALLGYEVEYDAVQHGYKVSRRPYDFEELRLLAECVRASKFISKSQEEHLLAAIENLCSDYQIEELQNEVYLVGRNKTTNKHIMAAMLKVNQAIRMDKQISFRYQKYTIKDRTQQVDRRGGATYKISPFKLIINDGYYYVLAWNSKWNHTITYRLDRMKGVEILTEPREGGVEFAKINMESYTQQHFGMFSGEKKTVSLRFTNNLLDTMVDRFGTGSEVFYRPDDDKHFVVTTQIAISDQFYGWLCGFRKMAQILSPTDVVSDFQNFLNDIAGKYQIDE